MRLKSTHWKTEYLYPVERCRDSTRIALGGSSKLGKEKLTQRVLDAIQTNPSLSAINYLEFFSLDLPENKDNKVRTKGKPGFMIIASIGESVTNRSTDQAINLLQKYIPELRKFDRRCFNCSGEYREGWGQTAYTSLEYRQAA